MSASLVPPQPEPFLNREGVMQDMVAWVERCRSRHAPCRMYVFGLEGLGVSSLIARFALKYHKLIGGRLIWLTGRHADGTPVTAGELLGRALRQLMIPESEQGSTIAEKVDTFRRVTANLLFMLVVDDLYDPAQMDLLAPANAPEAIIAATGPFRRRTLEGRNFEPFTPDFLPIDTTRTLLRTELQETAEAVDPTTLDALADLCGGIPLLVMVLAAQIRGRAAHADRLLTRLRDSKISLLRIDDEQRMARFLDTTYQGLVDDVASAYRQLGVVPATNFSVDAAASILAVDTDSAYDMLEKLAELNLLTPVISEHIPHIRSDRYAFHPVLRDDARTRALAEDPIELHDKAIASWITWCLRQATPLAAVVSARWWVAPVVESMVSSHPDGIPQFTRETALIRLDTESANLIDAVRAAHRAGARNPQLHDVAWQLCVVLWKYLHLYGLYEAWVDTHNLGLASAEIRNDRLGIMQVTSQLGAAHLGLREHTRARECFTRSLSIARELGHILGEQSALEWLGKNAAAEGRHHTALDLYRQSWEVAARADDTQLTAAERARVFAILLLQRSRVRLELDEYQQAAADAEQAIAHFDLHPTETDNSAKARQVLGRAQLGLDRIIEAVATLVDACEKFAGENVRRQVADTRRLLGEAYRAAGQSDQAATQYRSALDYYLSVGNPLADEVAAILAALEQ